MSNLSHAPTLAQFNALMERLDRLQASVDMVNRRLGKKEYSRQEAANAWGVDRKTVYNWIQKGKVSTLSDGRISHDEVLRIKATL